MAQELSAQVEQASAISQGVVDPPATARTAFHKLYRSLTWENLKTAVNAFLSNAAKLLWIALCILIFIIVLQDLSEDLVTIEPISVPKIFSENGYTPEVASRRLRDALSNYALKA